MKTSELMVIGASLDPPPWRARVDIVEDVRVDAAEHAGVTEGQSERPGQGPESDGYDEEDGPYEVRNGAQETEQRSRPEADPSQ